VTFDPVPAAVNVALTELVVTVEPLAGAVMLTVGTSESTVKVTVADPEPAEFVAVTTTVCAPCARPVKLAGEVQAAAALASSLQVVLVGELVAVNETEAVVLFRNAPLAGELIVTTGIDASETVKVVEALPVLPAWSVAVTVIVWLPLARPV
jgi:hypothetical protein